MSRLNFMSSIVGMVAELERRYRELKESQIVGSDAVKTFMTKPTSPVSVYLAPNQVKEVIVTFTPSDTSGKSTSGAYMLKWLPNQSDVHVQRLKVTDFSEQQWRVTMIGYGATAVVDFWVFSTGKGTVSWVVL